MIGNTEKDNLPTTQDSEICYRRLFESACDGILILDAVTRKITDVNPFMVELSGYSRDEFLGKELREIGLLKDEEAGKTAFRELQEKGYICYEALPLETKTSGCREIELIGNLYAEGDHQVIQCNIRDITDRKRAEAALEKSEQQYRFLSEGIMHQVWTARLDGKLDYVNGRTLEYFGRTFEQMIGDGWQSFVHPDDVAGCLKRWKKSLETGEYYEVEFRLKKADGTYCWHSGRATAGRDSDGKIIKWFGTNTDIN
nr:PAS domain S-box protein [Acidobacteriota bacterium]